MEFGKVYLACSVLLLGVLAKNFVQGDQICRYTVCYGDDYCCGGGYSCCYTTIYVYQLWWFWFIWIFILMLIIGCVIGIRRRRYQQRLRHIPVRVAQPVYGTTVVATPRYHVPPPPPARLHPHRHPHGHPHVHTTTVVAVPTAPAYTPAHQHPTEKPPPYQ